ncbi:hypothetical protein EUTSA_v10022482mg [Eutrema salsugineum]|uniref:UBC core domain-containing protein n=1 Tax=Eutrema salsugineum TaxID=72664 RepID=V4L596_EUTSA|nr:hypothetical protein EUTSA_v10022482mg [Eutrema salsugineum]
MIHLRELLQFPASGFGAGPVAENIYEWQATLLCPPRSPYEGGIFFISIHFPPEYPFRPPRVSWKTPILHPNIDKLRVFHPLLVTATWRVGTTVKDSSKCSMTCCFTLR